ncbi:hypothetical protein PR048_016040 [Dryococelus australis]|uniref:Uncharacterized protein n=1 Tax=Dryococelus australis TaxID=614101 RepID=A0ABQ9HJS4_9NEOP|nr:hypothetical protein PR048_016040 [Dryococelus australis]
MGGLGENLWNDRETTEKGKRLNENTRESKRERERKREKDRNSWNEREPTWYDGARKIETEWRHDIMIVKTRSENRFWHQPDSDDAGRGSMIVKVKNRPSYSQFIFVVKGQTSNMKVKVTWIQDCGWTTGMTEQEQLRRSEPRTHENPFESDIIRVKSIFSYLNGTPELEIFYKNECKKRILEFYSDADLGGDKKAGRSTTGSVYLYSRGAISWFIKRQCSVSISTTKAEIIAASEGTREMLWLEILLQEMADYKEVVVRDWSVSVECMLGGGTVGQQNKYLPSSCPPICSPVSCPTQHASSSCRLPSIVGQLLGVCKPGLLS